VTGRNRDREEAVDRLLASTLRARAEAASGAGCLDAETLAAWADGALDAREQAAAEAHAADCERCQALLAAMVRTTPPSSAAAPFRTRLLWWLAPIVPVAAALVIWIAVPNREPLQQSDHGVVAVDEPAPMARPSAQADVKARALPDAQAPRQAANQRDVATPAPVPPAGDLREQRSVAPLDKAAAPTPAATANALSEQVAIAPAVPGPTPASSAAPSAPSAKEADALARRDAASAPARLSAFAGAPESVVVSSNPATRFRLLRGGGVQRSADGGATWRTEFTGATDTLVAGSSPSPSVCWLVGPSGTVLLSIDGRSWRRATFPETVDLRAVTAADADSATVTTADGRVFVTADGGKTWSRGQNP
jgi:hypothetical protein